MQIYILLKRFNSSKILTGSIKVVSQLSMRTGLQMRKASRFTRNQQNSLLRTRWEVMGVLAWTDITRHRLLENELSRQPGNRTVDRLLSSAELRDSELR
jgi:hypothetical protein